MHVFHNFAFVMLNLSFLSCLLIVRGPPMKVPYSWWARLLQASPVCLCYFLLFYICPKSLQITSTRSEITHTSSKCDPSHSCEPVSTISVYCTSPNDRFVQLMMPTVVLFLKRLKLPILSGPHCPASGPQRSIHKMEQHPVRTVIVPLDTGPLMLAQ